MDQSDVEYAMGEEDNRGVESQKKNIYINIVVVVSQTKL